MQPSVLLTGLSGRAYEYGIYLMEGPWLDRAGNYAFAQSMPQGHTPVAIWRVSYIGQTDSFQKRFADHEVWRKAIAGGATHVLAHASAIEAARLAEERDLIRHWNPRLNQQHKTAVSPGLLPPGHHGR